MARRHSIPPICGCRHTGYLCWHPVLIMADTTLTASASSPARLDDLIHRLAWPANGSVDRDEILSREWLVTNGLGGYASGTVAGAIARRYHAVLIAALPAPLGRVVMLNYLS